MTYERLFVNSYTPRYREGTTANAVERTRPSARPRAVAHGTEWHTSHDSLVVCLLTAVDASLRYEQIAALLVIWKVRHACPATPGVRIYPKVSILRPRPRRLGRRLALGAPSRGSGRVGSRRAAALRDYKPTTSAAHCVDHACRMINNNGVAKVPTPSDGTLSGLTRITRAPL